MVPPQTLDARGRASSARRASPKFRFRLSPRNGKYALKVSKADLRTVLGLAAVSEQGATPITLEIEVAGAALATPTVSGELEFAYATKAGRTSRGTYVFARSAAASGAFRALRTTASEMASGGHRVVSRLAVAAPDGAPMEITGGLTLTIGAAAPIVVPQASLRVRGAGSSSTYTYAASQGAVAGLTRLSYSNRTRTLSLTTSPPGGVGMPAAGPGAAVSTDVAVLLNIETPDGTQSFSTTVELLRSRDTSRRWSR